MAISDKDTIQKEKAIRYCISNGLLPYLEVIVDNVREVTDVRTVITDLDVLGIEVLRRGTLKKILFDCKTVGKMSAINRAFWASGVMSYVGCDESYVILTKKSSEAHRLTARALGVNLFQESDFDSYAESSSIDYLNSLSYSFNIENWHNFYRIFEKHIAFKDAGVYLNTKIPTENDSAKALRVLLSISTSIKGELDPEKLDHMSIYFSIIMSFILVMTPISSQLSDIITKDMTKSEYETILKYYIMGGRDKYLQLLSLKKALAKVSPEDSDDIGFFPEWDEFVTVSRTFINSPSEMRNALIPCRELSLRCVSEIDKEKDNQLCEKIKRSNRTRQFIIASSNYCYKACGLPTDFHNKVKSMLSDIEV